MEGGEAPSFEVWESGRGSTHYRPTFWCHPQELVPPFPSPFSFTIYRYASGLDNGANEIRVDALRGSAQMKNATEPQKKKKKTMRGEGPPPSVRSLPTAMERVSAEVKMHIQICIYLDITHRRCNEREGRGEQRDTRASISDTVDAPCPTEGAVTKGVPAATSRSPPSLVCSCRCVGPWVGRHVADSHGRKPSPKNW